MPTEELRCKVCGGRLDRNLKCEYCGTRHVEREVIGSKVCPTHFITYVGWECPKCKEQRLLNIERVERERKEREERLRLDRERYAERMKAEATDWERRKKRTIIGVTFLIMLCILAPLGIALYNKMCVQRVQYTFQPLPPTVTKPKQPATPPKVTTPTIPKVVPPPTPTTPTKIWLRTTISYYINNGTRGTWRLTIDIYGNITARLYNCTMRIQWTSSYGIPQERLMPLGDGLFDPKQYATRTTNVDDCAFADSIKVETYGWNVIQR